MLTLSPRARSPDVQRGQHVVHKLKEKNDGVKVTNNRLKLEKTEYKARLSSPRRAREPPGGEAGAQRRAARRGVIAARAGGSGAVALQ